jgi:hypothetical protein
MGELRIVYGILIRKPVGKRAMGYLRIAISIILKWMLINDVGVLIRLAEGGVQ